MVREWGVLIRTILSTLCLRLFHISQFCPTVLPRLVKAGAVQCSPTPFPSCSFSHGVEFVSFCGGRGSSSHPLPSINLLPLCLFSHKGESAQLVEGRSCFSGHPSYIPPPSPDILWIPIYNYSYRKFIYVSILKPRR